MDDRAITVAELRRELQPLISQLRSDARDEREFASKLELLQNEVTASLVKRILLIKVFRQHMDPEKEAAIAPEAVEQRIEQEVLRRYNGDRAQLLADLAARGITLAEFRREMEEELIYWYMRRQERALFPKQSKTVTAQDVAAARTVRAAEEAAGIRRTPRATLPASPAVRQPRPAEPSERPVRQPRT